MENTGQVAIATVQTPGGVPTYEGEARIDGVPGSHAPVPVEFRDTAGSSCGALLPTGNAVDVVEGVRTIPLSAFSGLHTRICRPVGLGEAEVAALIHFMLSRKGITYDLKNIFDLARYFIRTPPLPGSMRRRALSLGSGEPTKAICSTLLAQAFASVRYPILPEVELVDADAPGVRRARREILHIRHHSLYTPRDFDLSPYFAIVKPTLERGFDYQALRWYGDGPEAEGVSRPSPPSSPRP